MILRALAAFAALGASPALAGGFAPVTAPAAPIAAPVAVVPPAPSSDWSGFYLGAQVGTGSFEQELFNGFETATLLEAEGTFFGLHAGYRRDFGRLVAGAELAYDMTDMDLTIEGAPPDLELGTLDSVARAGVQLGFDAGRVLPYVSAGIASGALSFENGELDALFEDSLDGRYVGLGADFAVTDRFTLGIEALRHDFDGPELDPGIPAPPGTSSESLLSTIALKGAWRF